MKKYLNCFWWIFLGMFAGDVVYTTVYQFFYPDPETLAILIQGGPIFAAAAPYSLLLFLLGRKSADRVLVPVRLFLSSAVIMGIAWMWLDTVYVKGPDWAVMLGIIWPMLYAACYVYVMENWTGSKKNDKSPANRDSGDRF